MKIGAFLDQMEHCWQADSGLHFVQGIFNFVQGKKVNSDIPQSAIPSMVQRLESISFALKVSKVALAVITALAGYLVLTSLLTMPPIVALFVIPIAGIAAVDGFRGFFILAKVQSVVDAFCQKKIQANLSAKGATTPTERAEWSKKFAEVKEEISSLLIVKFFGDEIPGDITFFSFQPNGQIIFF